MDIPLEDREMVDTPVCDIAGGLIAELESGKPHPPPPLLSLCRLGPAAGGVGLDRPHAELTWVSFLVPHPGAGVFAPLPVPQPLSTFSSPPLEAPHPPLPLAPVLAFASSPHVGTAIAVGSPPHVGTTHDAESGGAFVAVVSALEDPHVRAVPDPDAMAFPDPEEPQVLESKSSRDGRRIEGAEDPDERSLACSPQPPRPRPRPRPLARGEVWKPFTLEL